eukprot:gene53799-55042_t
MRLGVARCAVALGDAAGECGVCGTGAEAASQRGVKGGAACLRQHQRRLRGAGASWNRRP